MTLPERPRRIVLVGFMAAGKTEVGRDLAHRLGWRHVDLDQEIEKQTGRTIPEIFRDEGESAFRALEAQVTPAVASEEEVVISTGGGWVINPRSFASLPPDSLSVWLRVSADEVLRRLEAGPNQPVRPMLAGSHPRQRVLELVAVREPLYSQADLTIDTDDRSVTAVVEILEKFVVTGTRPPTA
jgi:shikimate kinase